MAQLLLKRDGVKVTLDLRIGKMGNVGKSAYQSYLDTTTDVPPLSEAAWSAANTIDPNTVIDPDYATDKLRLENTSGTNTGDQDLSGLQPKETGKGLSTNDYDDLAVLEVAKIAGKQDATDALLETDSDNIVGAINEVNSIAKGANQALSFDNYQDVITAMSVEGLNAGQNLYVDTLDVPDLWVKVLEASSVPYIYVSDNQFVNDILSGTQIGYYRLALLETQKVDLTNYYTKDETDQAIEDYASPTSHRHDGETITPDVVEFQTPASIPTNIGSTYYDAANKVLSTVLDGAVLQNGLELYVRVVNKTGAAINDGQAVYISGAQGNRPTATLAIANTAVGSNVIGVATQSIANNAEGFVTVFGSVDYNTTGLTDGATLYLSGTVAGALTPTEQLFPLHKVVVATALSSTNNGKIFVRPFHVFELAELHGVDLTETTPLDTDSILIEQTSTGKVKKSLFSTLKTFLNNVYGQLATTNTWALLQTFTSGVKTDTLTKVNGSGSYMNEDGGTIWHTISKRFTPSGTFSSNGTTVTTTSGQLNNSMIGAKIGTGTDKRIITAVANSNSCTVNSAFSQNYSGVSDWGVWGISRIIAADYTAEYNEVGVVLLYSQYNSSFLSGVLRTFQGQLWSIQESIGLKLSSLGRMVFTNSVDGVNGTIDVGIRRLSDGVLELYNGLTNGVLRDLKLRSLLSNDWNYSDNGTHTGDLIGDRRSKVVNDVEITERCTVSNATRGSGTWVKVQAFNEFGGQMISLTNKTGVASVKGSVVSISTTQDSAFTLQSNEFDAIGIVYESGIADGSECLIVISGIAQVLLENNTLSTRGNWVTCAVTDGRANATAVLPSGGTIAALENHFKEIGHCLETKAAGTNVLAKCVIHFN